MDKDIETELERFARIAKNMKELYKEHSFLEDLFNTQFAYGAGQSLGTVIPKMVKTLTDNGTESNKSTINQNKSAINNTSINNTLSPGDCSILSRNEDGSYEVASNIEGKIIIEKVKPKESC